MGAKTFFKPSEEPYIFPTQKRADDASSMLERMLGGDPKAPMELALARYNREAVAADFQFALANDINVKVQADYQDTETDWLSNPELMSQHPMSDYDPDPLMTFELGVDDKGKSGRPEAHRNGTLPIVAELAPYPEFAYKGSSGRTVSLVKHGANYSLSFEASTKVNRLLNFREKVIASMTTADKRTWRTEYLDALTKASNRSLAGGTLIGTGDTVVANAPFSVNAYREALQEIYSRTVNGRRVGVSNDRFFLFVNYKTKLLYDYVQSRNILELVKGDPATSTQARFTDSSSDNPTRSLTVVVDDYLPDDFWALVPYKSAVPDGREPFTMARLVGYETPDVRVNTATGSYIGGGMIPAEMGSFVNDSISYRIRSIGKVNLINDDAIIISTGKGK